MRFWPWAILEAALGVEGSDDALESLADREVEQKPYFSYPGSCLFDFPHVFAYSRV